MNPYQQKWMEILTAANLPGWEFEAVGEDISVTMPNVTDLKIIRDNLPAVLAQASLDIDIPHQPLKLFFKNGYEHFEYTITE